MKIYVNLKPMEIDDGSTVATMLDLCGYNMPGVAVAVNNKVIPRRVWASTELLPDSHVTIIKAVCGG